MLLRPSMCSYATMASRRTMATAADQDDDDDSSNERSRSDFRAGRRVRMDSGSGTYRETIHSGHFMVSDIDQEEEDDDCDQDTVAAVSSDVDVAGGATSSSVDDEISASVAATVLSDDSSSRDDAVAMLTSTSNGVAAVIGSQQLLLPQQSYDGSYDRSRRMSYSGGYDFEAATKETATTYNFGPSCSKSVSIEATLTMPFRHMTLAYSGKLTSPRWRTFKGMKMRWKDKIRLNNLIWRAWHMQFILKRRPVVCTFANPVEDNHIKPAAVVLEGKYWKRQTDTVRAEYKSWRISTQKSDLRHRGDYVNPVSPASLDTNLYEWQPRSNQSAHASSSMLIDDDTFGEYTDRLFNCLITSHPYPFPTARELGKSSNSDLIQPGLVQFQPNLDDFMDTFDVGLWSQKLPPVLEENDLATVSSVLNSSAAPQPQQNNSAFPGMDMMGMMQQQPQPSLSPNVQIKPEVSVPPRGPTTSRANFNQNFQSKVYSPSNELTSNASALSSASASPLRNSGLPGLATSSRYSAAHKMDATDTGSSAGLNDVPPLMDMQMSNLVKEETLQQQQQQQQRQSPAIYSAGPAQQQQGYLFPSARSPPTPDENSQRALVMHPSSPPHLLPSPPPPASPGKYMGGHHQQQHHHHHHQHKQQQQQRHDNRFTYESSSGKHHGGAFQTSPPRSQMVGPPLRASSSLVSIAATASAASNAASGSHVRRSSIGYDRAGGSRLQRKDDETMFAVPKPKGRTRSRSGPNLAHMLPPQQQQTSSTSPPGLIAPQPPPLPPPPPPPPLPRQSRQHLPQSQASTQSSCGALLAQLLSTGPFSATVDKVNAGRNSSPVAIQPAPIAPAVPHTIVMTPLSWPMVTSVNSLHNQVLMGGPSKVFGICPSPSPVATSAMSLTTKPTTSQNATVVTSVVEDPMTPSSPKAFRPKSDTEKKQYREHRRVCHINAEQKRRCNIKNGFDTLHHLVPCLSHSPNAKVSKAAMLQKAGDYIKQVKGERAQIQKEAESLRAQIESLNQAINMCQSQLPASGVPVPCQRPNKLQKMFEDYVKDRTRQNWKFSLFSRIIHPLLESYSNTVSTASFEDLCKTVLTWLEQHCSLVALRPVVSNSLRVLTMTTNILTDPDQIREEAVKDVGGK